MSIEAAARRIAKMDPWYQDPDDGWICVFCGAHPTYRLGTGNEIHNPDCAWVELVDAIKQDFGDPEAAAEAREL